jgi:hypothetical protein
VRRKLRSTRWFDSELMYIKIVAKKYNLNVDDIIRKGAKSEAVRIANEIYSKNKEVSNG